VVVITAIAGGGNNGLCFVVVSLVLQLLSP
jgi:hypothetical protein